MTRRNILSYAWLAMLTLGCNEVENLLKFPIKDQTSLRIQSASPLNLPLRVPTPDVTSDSQQQYENNNTSVNLVKDVRLEELKLSISTPDSKTFGFLKAVRIYISTDQNNEMELAHLDDIASQAKSVSLITTQENLDKYIKAPSYNLRTEVVTRETLTESVDILVDLKFRVTADTF
ncbi:MAG TPA: hypothetical protein VIQ51_03100 [Chryseosolibacter sp.]